VLPFHGLLSSLFRKFTVDRGQARGVNARTCCKTAHSGNIKSSVTELIYRVEEVKELVLQKRRGRAGIIEAV